MISQVDARIDEFDTQAKYLMQDVKKIGPNLKEIKAKLRKDWIPVWLSDPKPQASAPNATQLEYEEIKPSSSFLWQSALGREAAAPTQETVALQGVVQDLAALVSFDQRQARYGQFVIGVTSRKLLA